MSKLVCPVCGSSLSHDRVYDGIISHDISLDGEVTETYNDNNNYDSVYCSNDSSHEIDDSIISRVLYLVQ